MKHHKHVLEQQENPEGGAQQFGGRDKQYGMEQLDRVRTLWNQMTTASALNKQPALSTTDYKSLHDAIHKEGAAPSPTDKRLAIERKARATESEADLKWIDAQYQVADRLTKHASRNSEEVSQQVVNHAK